MTAVLLDTCAIIFIADGQAIAAEARRRIVAAAQSDGILVSPVSAWEIGLLAGRKGVAFRPDAKSWFQSFLAYPGVRLTPLTPEAAIDSSFLPEARRGRPLHADPADRLLIATARALGAPIVTRDRAILACAEAGIVTAIAC
jgi:PIN domain nuclease of toxin-antitoxin system